MRSTNDATRSGHDAAEKSDSLRVGLARADITPPAGIEMCGYAARKEPAKGVHDPLLARVALLDDRRVSLALVSTDLVWLYSERVVNEARQKWGIDHVIVCGTHTHSGPRVLTKRLSAGARSQEAGPARPREDQAGLEKWLSSAEDKIIAAVGEAAQNRFHARMGAARGVLKSDYLAHNRRFVRPDGTVTMMWANPERIPTSPVDPRATVLRIDDETGKTRALLVHYACHAVVLGALNLLISADYPGAMSAYIEEKLDEGSMAMFIQGAAGDIDPYERWATDLNPDVAHGFEIVERTGVSLGKGALELAEKVVPLRATDGALIKVKESTVSVGYREGTKSEEAGVMAVLLGKELALAVIGGEPFVQHQLDLDEKSPVATSLLLGYAYSGAGAPLPCYLPSVEATRTGGYGADGGRNSPLQVGAGERLVDEAAASIRDLLYSRGE